MARGNLLYQSAKLADLVIHNQDEVLEYAKANAVPKKLHFTATVSADVVNKNFTKIAPEEYDGFAASFSGVPFLKDHGYLLDDRGGTVVRSWTETRDGKKLMRQEIDAFKPWAVEGVLDGTVDRFSIGWDLKSAECSICGKKWGLGFFGGPGCDHEPGEDYEGKTAEILMRGCEGEETSAVLRPAVPGTEVSGMTLSAFQEVLNKKYDGKGVKEMFDRIRKILGITEATPEKVVEAAETEIERLTKLSGHLNETISEVRKAVDVAENAPFDDVLKAIEAKGSKEGYVPATEAEELRGTIKKLNTRKKIDAALAGGFLTAKQAEDGGWAEGFGLRDPESFDKFLAEQPQVVPVGVPAPKDPVSKTLDGGLTEDDEHVIERTGVSRDEFIKVREQEIKNPDSERNRS